MSHQAAFAPFKVLSVLQSVPSRPLLGDYSSGRGMDNVSRFYSLLAKWRAETFYSPSMKEKIENPSFQAIVREIGEDAIPMIIKEIRHQPDFLVFSLYFITGENPVPSAAQGKVTEMADAWLDWYARTYPHVH